MTAYTTIAPLQWPAGILDRESMLSWELDPASEMSPPALDGTEQGRNSIGGPRWRMTMAGVQLRKSFQVLLWQKMEGLIEGTKNPVELPFRVPGQAPVPAANTVKVIGGGWAARAVSGRIELTDSGEINEGSHFSDFDGTLYGRRMYRVLTVAAVGGNPTWRDITFLPPLRFAAANNHGIDFKTPSCVMKLAQGDGMRLELRLRRFADPSPDFVEMP